MNMPDINIVDFTDPEDIGGFVSLICQLASNAGMMMHGFRPSRDSNELRQTARMAVQRLDRTMPAMPASDAFAAIRPYDMAHRLAYAVGADAAKLNQYILKAFELMIRGDRDVDEYAMFREIRRGVARHDQAYSGKPMEWLCIAEERWHSDFAHGRQTELLTAYDALCRAAILLQSDLFAYEGNGQLRYKQSLFERYSHYLDHHDTSDRRMLTALEHFLNASGRFMTTEKFMEYHNRLESERLGCIKVNRFMREAITHSARAAV